MKKYIIPAIAALGLSLASCDDVLDRPQLNLPDDDTFWKTESDLRMYAYGFYTNYFVGYNSGWSSDYTPVRGLTFSDDFATSGQQTNFINSVPTSLGGTTAAMLSQTHGETWCFAYVRKANVMLERLEKRMKDVLSEEAFAHWTAVAKFFKAYEYVRLVTSFGDVPWYETTVTTADLDELYKDRDSRDVVMGHVYDLCKDIMTDMRTNDGTNVLNRYIAAGFISRWMLFEGTWQKYNENNETLAKKYLELAVEAGDYVINSGKYSIATSMPELFGSNDLSKNAECLMYRNYSDAEAVRHCIASYCNSKEAPPAVVNLAFLKSVICQDGKPYKTSTVENANDFSLGNFARSRDPRFESCFSDVPNKNSATRVYGRKFIDRYAWTLPSSDATPAYNSVTNINACPIMRYGEVLLNWIEAKAELGNVSQDDINISINALRDRPIDETGLSKGLKNTAHMQLSEIDASFDPDRDPDVDPLIWEIRRERRLELVFEYSRLVDIKRWHKLEYMDNEKYPDTMLGPWIDYSAADYDTEISGGLSDGVTSVRDAAGNVVVYDAETDNTAQMVGFYIPTSAKPRNAFSDRSYLYPIGQNVINEYKTYGYTISQTDKW